MTPRISSLPVLGKVRSAYLLWYSYYHILPKVHRHSLGVKIDKLLVEIIEAIVVAEFLSKEAKLPYVKLAVRKTDVMKVSLMILWETESLDNKKYIALSEKIENFGRDLGGWIGKLSKENSAK